MTCCRHDPYECFGRRPSLAFAFVALALVQACRIEASLARQSRSGQASAVGYRVYRRPDGVMIAHAALPASRPAETEREALSAMEERAAVSMPREEMGMELVCLD